MTRDAILRGLSLALVTVPFVLSTGCTADADEPDPNPEDSAATDDDGTATSEAELSGGSACGSTYRSWGRASLAYGKQDLPAYGTFFSQITGIRVFANNQYALQSNDVDYAFQGGRFVSLTSELRNRSDAYIEFTGPAQWRQVGEAVTVRFTFPRKGSMSPAVCTLKLKVT